MPFESKDDIFQIYEREITATFKTATVFFANE